MSLLFWIMILIGVALLGVAIYICWTSAQTCYSHRITATFVLTLVGVWVLVMGCFGLGAPDQPAAMNVQQVCEENAICYELVQTVAEYTDYTEEEITEFFLIVSDDIDAWTAIHLLDGSLTGEQIDALLEISAMKQGE